MAEIGYRYKLALINGDNLPVELAHIALMQYMSWSYRDFIDTPRYVIDLIFEKMRIDSEKKSDTIPT